MNEAFGLDSFAALLPSNMWSQIVVSVSSMEVKELFRNSSVFSCIPSSRGLIDSERTVQEV